MSVRKVLLSFPTTVLVATLVIALCVWFLGPLLAFGDWRPLDGFVTRAATVAGLVTVALLVIVLVLWRRRARERKLCDEIVTAPTAQAGAATSGEIIQLQDKLKTALAQLRRSKLGRGHLYQLPWYVVIGPPGAGKTTAIEVRAHTPHADGSIMPRDPRFAAMVCAITRLCPTVSKACRSKARDASLAKPLRQYRRTRR
jgi:type VI protein secretion system component VasK